MRLLARIVMTALISLFVGLTPILAALVPRPPPEMIEPSVALELERAHQAVDLVVGDPQADVNMRADAWGNLGRRYAAYELWDAAAVAFGNAQELAGDVHAWCYLAGYAAFQKGALEIAAEQLERATVLEPGDASTWLRLGEVLLGRGHSEQALLAFARAEAGGTRAAAAFGRGRSLAALGRDDEAVRSFERALSLQPAASQVRLPLAMALRRLGHTEAARRQLALRGNGSVMVIDPLVEGLGRGAEGGALAKRQGDQAVIVGKLRAAADAYRRAVVADPERFSYRKSLGLTLNRLGDVSGAQRELDQAARLLASVPTPQRPRETVEVAFALGGLAVNRGDDRVAAEHFRRVVELDACYADAHVELGNLAGRAGDLEAARSRFDQAIACAPNHREALLQRATTSMDLGGFADAVTDLERCLDLRPDDDAARRLLDIARSRVDP